MRTRATERTSASSPSPSRLMLLTAMAIFAAEACIMFVFEWLPKLPGPLEALTDATALIGVTLPVLYFTWVLPLRRESAQRVRFGSAVEAGMLHDSLTGLPNRAGFHDCILQELQKMSRLGGAFTLVVLDVSRFGEINAAFGDEQGDSLLKQLANRLQGNASSFGVAARLGSDVFGVLLGGVDLARAEEAAGRLHGLMELPFMVDGTSIEVEAHAGFAVFPNHGNDAQVLVQRAEMALQRAKKRGERCGGYVAEGEAQSRRRLGLLGMLKTAVERGGLSLAYQPQIDLVSGRATGVEALVRWNHPELGPISPSEFIPLAEQTSLIRPLTLWVLEEAIRQMAAWKSAGTELEMSVNLSARNLADAALPTRVTELLTRWDVAPQSLTLEITESAVMEGPEQAGDVLEKLRGIGVGLAIDDFGTGYSSLTYLRTIPASELKIDRSFVRDITINSETAIIVRAVIALAHELGLKVVAEGVEDEDVLARLQQLGCDLAQGHLLSRPLLANQVEAFFAKKSVRILGVTLESSADSRRLGPGTSTRPGVSRRPALRQSLRSLRFPALRAP